MLDELFSEDSPDSTWALEAIDGNPGAQQLLREISEILSHDSFRDLPAPIHRRTIAALVRHDDDPFARQTIKNLATSPGFRGLGDTLPRLQGVLLNYVSGTNAELSTPARNRLAMVMSDPTFAALSGEDQAERLILFLGELQGSEYRISRNQNISPRIPYTLDPPRVTARAFSSEADRGEQPSFNYRLHLDQRSIEIIVPQTLRSENGRFIGPELLAQAIASQSATARDAITLVIIEPNRNSDDSYWSQRFGTNHQTWMTAGADGTVSLFPTDHSSAVASDPVSIVGSLAHEVGHVISRQTLGDYGIGQGWIRWDAARAEDVVVPSSYGASSVEEDFAETYRLYSAMQGTPWEEELREILPARFRILDEVLDGRNV